MAGIFGGSTGQYVTPRYTSLQLQTSSQGLCIPIVWGANRLAPNVIDAFGFTSQDAGKGKGGKSGNYDYFANLILALCEGATQPDGGEQNIVIGEAWSQGQEINFADTGFGLFPGNSSQLPWSTAVAAGRGLSYAYTAYLAQGNTPLGSSGTIPQYNFEIYSTFHGHNVGLGSDHELLADANFGDIIPDFLCNPRYTLNFDKMLLEGFDVLTTYHLASNIFVSPILKDQEQVSSILQRWGTIGNFWPFWNGTTLKCVCLGDTTVTGNGVTYTPNVAPIVDLGPDDFITTDKNGNKNSPPVTVTRKDPADGYNQVQLNCNIRSNQYQNTPFRWSDQSNIDQAGIQAPNIISSTEICYFTTAATCVQLIGKRALYIRNDYAFKLLQNFIYLEPGDIVTLTDPNIGLNKFPVRIKTLDEDDKDTLSFVAEEFPQGVGTPTTQEFEPWGGSEPWNVNTPPGSVNPPGFIQPDPSLTQGQAEVWASLSGGPNWGGCGVFLSFDGTNYTELGTAEVKSVQGTLTAAIAQATGLDTTNTLSIDTTESSMVLPTGATDADAQALRTLILVDDELMAYGSVTPTGSFTADLMYLERGAYGTTPASHNPGAPFTRVDSTVAFKYSIPTQYLGDTLFFKFPSANVFGNEPQTLAECVEYSFTADQVPAPTGATVNYVFTAEGSGGATPPALVDAVVGASVGSNFNTGYLGARWSAHPEGTMGQVYGTATITNPGTITQATLAASGDGYEYLDVQVQTSVGVPISAWSADIGQTTAPPPTSPSGVNQFDANGNWLGVLASWVAPSGTPSSYNLWGYSGSSILYGSAPGNATSFLIPATAIPPYDPAAGPPAGLNLSVQAVYNGNGSIPTDFVLVTGAAPLAGLITSPSATAESAAALIQWDPPSGSNQPTFYRIEYWDDNVNPYHQVDIAAPASQYTIRGLTSGSTYTVAPVTYNGAGTAEVYAGSPSRPTLTPQVTVVPT